MDTSSEWTIVVDRKRFTSEHNTVGGDEEVCNNHRRTK